jgi:hypothetical protein
MFKITHQKYFKSLQYDLFMSDENRIYIPGAVLQLEQNTAKIRTQHFRSNGLNLFSGGRQQMAPPQQPHQKKVIRPAFQQLSQPPRRQRLDFR